ELDRVREGLDRVLERRARRAEARGDARVAAAAVALHEPGLGLALPLGRGLLLIALLPVDLRLLVGEDLLALDALVLLVGVRRVGGRAGDGRDGDEDDRDDLRMLRELLQDRLPEGVALRLDRLAVEGALDVLGEG